MTSLFLLHSHSVHQQILFILSQKISVAQLLLSIPTAPRWSKPLLFLSWTILPAHQQSLRPPYQLEHVTPLLKTLQ